MKPAELLQEPWAFGPWCWRIDEVRLLPTPLASRGMQGLFPLDLALEATLSALCPTGYRTRWGMTLLQPFATAIAIGPKRIENRPWRRNIPPTGLWVGLHAGKALYDRAEELLEEWRDDPYARGPGIWPEAPPLEELPRGAMLGVMHVAEILRYPVAGSLL